MRGGGVGEDWGGPCVWGRADYPDWGGGSEVWGPIRWQCLEGWDEWGVVCRWI